jgi:short-subunit dehydrogenase
MKVMNSTVAVVTGASSGLGAALAINLGQRGAKVGLVARRQERLQEVAKQIQDVGGTPLVISGDVSNQIEAQNAIGKTIDAFGTIDLLINNAGRELRASVENTTQSQLESLFALNVFSMWYTTSAALPIMKAQKQGHIVNISSISGRLGSPLHSAYIASKHAVVGFTAALRTELIDTGVEASVVCPIGILTELDEATEGGGMGSLYAKGLQQLTTELYPDTLTYPWNAFLEILNPEDAANRIIEGVEAQISDIYTHYGSEEIALKIMQNRSDVEHLLKPLFVGMKSAHLNNCEFI